MDSSGSKYDNSMKNSAFYTKSMLAKDRDGGFGGLFLGLRDVKNGSRYKIFFIVCIIISVLTMIVCGIGIDKVPKKSTQHYIFIGGCGISALIFIMSIVAIFTVVKSLQIEDIMVTGMQRLSAGNLGVRDFQETAGNYFRNRLYNGSGNLNKYSNVELARRMGEDLQRVDNAPTLKY